MVHAHSETSNSTTCFLVVPQPLGVELTAAKLTSQQNCSLRTVLLPLMINKAGFDGTITERVPSLIASTGSPDNALDHEELACEPTDKKVRAALIQLKNGKCPGEDSITAEVLKLGGETTVRWLVALSQAISREEEIPEDWWCQITIPLHKKGQQICAIITRY